MDSEIGYSIVLTMVVLAEVTIHFIHQIPLHSPDAQSMAQRCTWKKQCIIIEYVCVCVCS